MSVYVDDAFIPYRGMRMCHMMADSTAELLAMARAIGIDPKWVQAAGTSKEHMDVCRTKRADAVRNGAIEVSQRQLARMRKERTEVGR